MGTMPNMNEQQARALAQRVREATSESGGRVYVDRASESMYYVVFEAPDGGLHLFGRESEFEWRLRQAQEQRTEQQRSVEERAQRLGTSSGMVGRILGQALPGTETQGHGRIRIERQGNEICEGYGDDTDQQSVDALIQSYVLTLVLSCRSRLTITWNHIWSRTETGEVRWHGLRTVNVSTAIHREGDILADQSVVQKTWTNETLREALRVYNNEVIEQPLPLPGVYKALETIVKTLPDRRRELARLAGENDGYVQDVMETANAVGRHRSHGNRAHRKLTDDECVDRTARLIEAYARSLDG